MKSWSSILALVFLVALWLGVSGLGAWSTSGSVATWYPTLAKPEWNPPARVFVPVWTVLYLMMATAAWLVWRKAGLPGAARPLAGALLV